MLQSHAKINDPLGSINISNYLQTESPREIEFKVMTEKGRHNFVENLFVLLTVKH